MKIDNEFTVNVPVDHAWKVLTDLEGIAPCLPGAQLTGVDGDVFTGKVKIKVGPVVSEYAGTAQFVEKDDAAHHAVISAKGKDSRGAGTASAMIHAQLRAEGLTTVVVVNTDLNITGKIAQFGSGMIKEVSAKLLAQFTTNLEAKLLVPASVVDSAPVSAPVPAADSAGKTQAPAVVPARTPVAVPEPPPLDLMALAGGSVYKRAIPLAVAVAVVALIVYLIAR